MRDLDNKTRNQVKVHPQTRSEVTEELMEIEELPKGGNKFVTLVFVALVILGVATGYALSRNTANSNNKTSSSDNSVALGKNSVGSTDTKIFKDSAVGTIEEGGLDGEGSHKLIRDGGPSQTVYMISSVVDLQEFVGKKVTVWGQTIAAKKVPWLMDVGRVDMQME